MNINSKIKKNVAELHAYNPDISAAKYKMDANESPYDLPASVKKSILKKMQKINFNRYPDSGAMALKKAVAKKNRVKPENIFFGNGSDEIINYLLQTFCAPGDAIVMPKPTFEMYRISAVINSNKVIEVPLDDRFDLDDRQIIRSCRKNRAKIVFLATPNNPTGNCFSVDRIMNIIKNIII